MYSDIMEFARNYFNNHDKSSGGTFITTLTCCMYACMNLKTWIYHMINMGRDGHRRRGRFSALIRAAQYTA
uniref:Uncharacterized protein n=1 Tax=Glossina palpalis gambiensis TaxID=67801 RepID=A0A1B0C3X1_9MUSC